MRRLLCNRRGEEDIWNVITLVAGAMVGIFLVLIVYRFSSTDQAYTTFFAKDGAMLADAVLAVPQNIEVVYPREFKNNYARFKDGQFQVFTSENASEYNVSGYTPYRYSFIPRKGIFLDDTLKPLSVVYFIKNQTAMFISNIPTILSAERVVGIGETALPKSRDLSGIDTGATSGNQEQNAKLSALYVEYQGIESLCFKDVGLCEKELNNHKELCKEFQCACITDKTKRTCPSESPYFIFGLNIPAWLNKAKI